MYLEGGLGVGKTTVLEELSRDPLFVAMAEPVEEWNVGGGRYNILEEWYAANSSKDKEDEEEEEEVSRRRAAFVRLQVLVSATMLEREVRTLSALEAHPGRTAVLERSPSTVLTFLDCNESVVGDRDGLVLRRLVRAQVDCVLRDSRDGEKFHKGQALSVYLQKKNSVGGQLAKKNELAACWMCPIV